MRYVYKGDWRVKEYKPYCEKLEEENAKLREHLEMQTVCSKPAPPLFPVSSEEEDQWEDWGDWESL